MAYVIFKFVAGVMERIVEQNLLYDFYGELLNDHQKKIYEDAIYNDLSLSEIADEYGISRQGVHDLIKRVTKTLDGYEAKLHLIQKFLETKDEDVKVQLSRHYHINIHFSFLICYLIHICNNRLHYMNLHYMNYLLFF